MFAVGQKVVCIDDARRCELVFMLWHFTVRTVLLDHNLNRGDVYTVTAVQSFVDDGGTQHTLIHVDGALNFERPDIGFPPCQFRRVVEKKTDISIFTEMLTPKREPAKV